MAPQWLSNIEREKQPSPSAQIAPRRSRSGGGSRSVLHKARARESIHVSADVCDLNFDGHQTSSLLSEDVLEPRRSRQGGLRQDLGLQTGTPKAIASIGWRRENPMQGGGDA